MGVVYFSSVAIEYFWNKAVNGDWLFDLPREVSILEIIESIWVLTGLVRARILVMAGLGVAETIIF